MLGGTGESDGGLGTILTLSASLGHSTVPTR